MTNEELLKDYILSQYKSIRQFCLQNNFAYSTVDSIFKRGINGSSVTLVISVCDRLGISIDGLMNGSIVKKSEILYPEISEREKQIILAYRQMPEMQAAVDRLLGIKETEPGIQVYRAARSDNNHEDEIITISAERLQRLKDAPETDEDL